MMDIETVMSNSELATELYNLGCIDFASISMVMEALEKATAPLLARIAELEKQVKAARAEGYPQGVREYNPVPPKVVHTVTARAKLVGRGKPLDQ